MTLKAIVHHCDNTMTTIFANNYTDLFNMIDLAKLTAYKSRSTLTAGVECWQDDKSIRY